MQKLIEGAKMIKEFIKDDNSILSVRFIKNLNTDTMKYRTVADVHVKGSVFKDLVEDLNIQPCYVEVTERDNEQFPIELEICVDGIYFTTIITEHEYEMDYREWLYEEPNIDEEFITSDTPKGMTAEQVRMKEAGINLYRDFI